MRIFNYELKKILFHNFINFHLDCRILQISEKKFKLHFIEMINYKLYNKDNNYTECVISDNTKL